MDGFAYPTDLRFYLPRILRVLIDVRYRRQPRPTLTTSPDVRGMLVVAR